MNLIAQRIMLTRRPVLSLGIELRWQSRWICLCSHLPGPSSNQQQLEPTNDGLSPEVPDSAKAEPSTPSVPERVPKFVDWTEEWTKAELQLKELAIQENKWTPVYRFKSLVIYWIVLRFTLFFVCFSIFFLVAVICQRLKEKGTVDLLDFWPQLLFLGFAILTNYFARRYLPRLVAVISVDSRSRSIYRIGHMTGLGFRRNEFARLGDIRPLAYGDTGGVGKLPKLRWTFRPQSEYLLLPMTDFEILDKEAAYLLFGSIQYYQSPAAAQLLEEMAKAAELEAGDEQQNVVAAGMEEQKQQQHESTTPKNVQTKVDL